MLFKDGKPASGGADAKGDRAQGGAGEKERAASFIGQTVRLDGHIASDDDLTIEGRFKGDIDVKKSLFIGIEGYVEAQVHASSVTIAGHVRGSVAADSKVKILDSGVMDGTLESPKLIISEGGQLRGQVNRSEK